MKVRDLFLFVLNKFLGRFTLIHSSVRFFYLSILTPGLSRYLKYKHKNILQIFVRHSLLDGKHFNAFLSDIDLTVVVKNNSATSQILKSCFQLKKIFIMLDVPEVYTEDEYKSLKFVQNHSDWEIINTFWHIRKINWNLKLLELTPTRINILKLTRSNQRSFEHITGYPNFKEVITLNDLIHLRNFSSSKPSNDMCFYSTFLETNGEHAIKIILSKDEFVDFNYLMPDHKVWIKHENLKKLIMRYELLITLASLRIDQAKSLDTRIKNEWSSYLINQIS